MASPAFVTLGKPLSVVVTSTSGFCTVVVVWQSPGSRQTAPLPPEGSTLLMKLPLSVATADTFTWAAAPCASPAGTLQVRTLPTRAEQVVGAVGVTTMLLKLPGKLSVRITAAVVAPVPPLLAARVHVRVSPT